MGAARWATGRWPVASSRPPLRIVRLPNANRHTSARGDELRRVSDPARASPAGAAYPRARILLVDDEPANLVALEAILAPLGEELVRASSGQEALRQLLQGEFAVILLDVRMPGMDGIETAETIKRRDRNRATPILFLTANAKTTAQVFRGYSHGAVDYLLSPFDPEILRAKVSVFVDLWRKGELIRQQAAQLREKEARALERRSEIRFRALTDSMPQCVWAALPDGDIHYCNRVWTEYAGAEAGIGFFDAVPEQEVGDLRAAWAAMVQGTQGAEREQRLRRRDGELRWHLLRVVPERDERGAVTGWIATATDIDYQKHVEEERATLLVREQEARAQAENANRTKDEFLAVVSHELRTPLTAMLGWTRMLRRPNLGKDKLEHGLEVVERSARAEAQIVDDVLDVSRIIGAKLRIRRRPMDLSLAVRAAADVVRPAAEAKGVELRLELPEGATPFVGDPERLQQIVWNLLSNAVKFTPGTGTVRVELSRLGPHVEIAVADTGIGIAPQFLRHVFDRFRQADSSTTRAQGGLGLGLAIVRHLVEAHGGTVRAESEGEGRGARLTVQLPVENAPVLPPQSPGERAELGSSALSGVHVLLVEDEPDAREVISDLLASHGASVEAAASATEAIGAVSRAAPDVIVSDIGLPQEDGYALIRRVRELPDAHDVPALALTAYADEAHQRRALEAGFQRRICKPAEPGDLVASLASLVVRRAL